MGSASPGKPASGDLPEEKAESENCEEMADSSMNALFATNSCSSSSSAMPQKREDESLDRQIAACSEGGAPKSEQRPRAADDPAFSLKVSVEWKAELQKIRQSVEDPSVSDEEKIRILHEALQQRIDDTRAQEEVKASVQKRLESLSADRERYDAEVQRIATMKVKLEACCREQKEQMNSLAKENQKLAEEERERHSELKEKFQAAIQDVQEKMDAELEVRQGFLKENDDLRSKLQKFNETYEAQEAQLAEQQEAREKEMQAATERLKEHEAMCTASKTNATQLEKQNETLRKTQTVLQNDLQGILKKFDEFSKQVSGSNKRHSECKEEIDSLQAHMEELEKENSELRSSARLSEVAAEQQVMQKQRDALEKLCDNLQKENKGYQQQLREKR
ncbi:unnamed protein product [Effrenium voratum]|uniref:Uncharacterized protein n=2 Tax=Effrenium voratum TaxID=2562239 RepID=A0AA36N9G8_9DINO|nr:unnamed protein product [Effrenium voratum]CAJ1404030.1 unnamed protein product [Effrenium voratum]CAJ1441754.1 unnamed protein product [Effrenium voratum]